MPEAFRGAATHVNKKPQTSVNPAVAVLSVL